MEEKRLLYFIIIYEKNDCETKTIILYILLPPLISVIRRPPSYRMHSYHIVPSKIIPICELERGVSYIKKTIIFDHLRVK